MNHNPLEDPCPVCTEEMTTVDKLECGHYIHPACVKRAADVLQDQLAESGYPTRKYARCPICRADLTNILAKPATWYGEITLTTEQLCILLHTLEAGKGMIAADAVPHFISDQMPNAHSDEQREFTIKAATILWMTRDSDLPQTMKIRQVKNGRQRRVRDRIIF